MTEQEKQLNIEMRQKLATSSVPNEHDEEDNAIAPLADRRSRLAWDCGDARRVGMRCQNIQSDWSSRASVWFSDVAIIEVGLHG